MTKLLATLVFLFAIITNAYSAQLTLNKIDGVPYVSGMTVDLTSIKVITGTVTAGNTNVQLDLLNANGNILKNTFVSQNFGAAGSIDMNAAGTYVTSSLSTLTSLANGSYVIKARITDCSVTDLVTFSCLSTVQTFSVTQYRAGQTATPTAPILPEGTGSATISTVAGDGYCMSGGSCFGGDGGQATLAKLYNPSAVALDKLGNLYIAD